MNLKIFFTWWNRQTFGTFLKTLFFGKYMGKDEFGNKYYKNKQDESWVIYSSNIEATKRMIKQIYNFQVSYFLSLLFFLIFIGL